MRMVACPCSQLCERTAPWESNSFLSQQAHKLLLVPSFNSYIRTNVEWTCVWCTYWWSWWVDLGHKLAENRKFWQEYLLTVAEDT